MFTDNNSTSNLKAILSTNKELVFARFSIRYNYITQETDVLINVPLRLIEVAFQRSPALRDFHMFL